MALIEKTPRRSRKIEKRFLIQAVLILKSPLVPELVEGRGAFLFCHSEYPASSCMTL